MSYRPPEWAQLASGDGAVHEVDAYDVSHAQIPVLYARRRCLYDHLQRLQEFADELGIGPLQADVLDETLLALEA